MLTVSAGTQVQHVFVTAPAVTIAASTIILLHRGLLFSIYAFGVVSNIVLRIADSALMTTLTRLSTRLFDSYKSRKVIIMHGYKQSNPGIITWGRWCAEMTPTVSMYAFYLMLYCWMQGL